MSEDVSEDAEDAPEGIMITLTVVLCVLAVSILGLSLDIMLFD